MTNHEERDKKLAVWAGFKPAHPNCGNPKHMVEPKGGGCASMPDFPQSLDVCFKWLVPAWNTKKRVIGEWIENIIFCFMAGDLIRCTIQMFDVGPDVWADAETSALALCLAIEKLIDKEVKDEKLAT